MLLQKLERDFTLLMKTFIAKKSLRYKDFCACWNDLNFSKLTNGCTAHNDYVVILEQIYNLCFIYFQESYQESARTCSLYILYSFFFLINKPNYDPNWRTCSLRYFKDRVNSPILIRTTMANYERLLRLVEWLEEKVHLDAVFAFRALQEHHAFLFCLATVPSTRTPLWTHRLISPEIRGGLPALKVQDHDKISEFTETSDLVEQLLARKESGSSEVESSLVEGVLNSYEVERATRIIGKYNQILDQTGQVSDLIQRSELPEKIGQLVDS